MSLSALDYQVVVSGNYGGTVPTKNIFYWQANTTGGSAVGVYTFMVADVLPEIAKIQSSQHTYTDIEVFNLVTLTDFYSGSFSIAGIRASECTSPFNAWKYRYNRPTRAVRNGWKSFCGVAEADQSNGVAISGMLPILNTLSAVLEGTVNYLGVEFAPCIGGTVEVPLESDPTKTKYVVDTLYPITEVAYVRIASQANRHL